MKTRNEECGTRSTDQLWKEWQALPEPARSNVAKGMFAYSVGFLGASARGKWFFREWAKRMAETLPPEPDPKPDTAMPGVGKPVHADHFGNGGDLSTGNAERGTRNIPHSALRVPRSTS